MIEILNMDWLDNFEVSVPIEMCIWGLWIAGSVGVVYKKYKSMMADGKITFDELLDAVDDVKEKVEEAEEQIEILEKAYDKYNVAELKDMLKEKGLPISGKKADLIARLEDSE
jgi:polyhydroxyalkanoate synthesis regulator phasin